MANQSTDKLVSAGDIIIEDVRLVSYNGFEINIKKLLASFVIYEDIYSNGISGSITILDAQNLAKNVPLIGQEELYISFYTPGVDSQAKNLRAKVFKVSAQLHGDEGSVTTLLKLEFASPLIVLSNTLKMNRSMVTMPYSKMVRSIYDDLKKLDSKLPNLDVEETVGTPSVIISNWSPLYAINWMSYRSTSSRNSMACDYVFYEDLLGYKYRSISSMKEMQPVCTYRNISPGSSRDPNTGERNVERELRSIMQHTIGEVNDKMRLATLGTFASTQLVVETTTKSYYTQDYSYKADFNKMPKMNSYPIVNYDNPVQESVTAYMKYHMKSHYSFDGTDDSNFIDKSLNRQAQMNLMNNFTMSIKVFGDSTIRPGDIVNIEFTAPESREKTDEELDKYLSGKYMVVCICHEYMEGLHEMLLTISRDSYSEPIPDNKEKDISES